MSNDPNQCTLRLSSCVLARVVAFLTFGEHLLVLLVDDECSLSELESHAESAGLGEVRHKIGTLRIRDRAMSSSPNNKKNET